MDKRREMRTKEKVETHNGLEDEYLERKCCVWMAIHRGMRELLCNFILIGNDMYMLQLNMVVSVLLGTVYNSCL